MIDSHSSPGPGRGPGLAYSRALLVLFTVSILFWSSAHAACYRPNGTDLNAGLSKEVYQPCDSGDEHSMCCALNRSVTDRCRSDGLCFSTWDSNVWRVGCTDPTWKSSSCIKLCISGIGQYIAGIDFDRATSGSTVTPCDNGSYCCGNGTLGDACCREGRGLFVLNGKAMSETASSSSTKANLSPSSRNDLSQTIGAFTSTTAPQDSSTYTSPASSSSSPSAANPSDKTGVIVGGVVGGTAVLALLSGIIAWTWMHRNRQNPQGHGPPQAVWTGQTEPGEYLVPKDNGIHEVAALKPIPELELRPIAELEPRPLAELEHSRRPH